MSFKFWSDKEVKIVKNYTAKECLKHNLLPGRTASMIGAKRSLLVGEGVNVKKNKYEPIKTIEKIRTNNSYKGTVRFYTPEDDKIILGNSNSRAAELLSRSKVAISVRRSYINSLNGEKPNYVTSKAGINKYQTKNNNYTSNNSINKDLNLTINDIELKVTNVRSIWVDKNNIDIKTH